MSLSFVLVLVVFIVWLVSVIRHELFYRHGRGNPMIPVFITLAAFIVAEVVLHVAIALMSPADARTPKDEREHLIDLRASRVAFYVLLIGTFLSIGIGMHLPGANRFLMANCMMGSIITALLVRFGTQIVLSRRDA